MSYQTQGADPSPSPATGAAADGLPLVRIVADLACPWCWIGFTRLLRAVGHQPVHLVWEPFLLNPHLPPRGIPRQHYLQRKFGSVSQARKEWRRAAMAAAAEGLELPFHDTGRQPCTLVAHSAVLAAAARGRLAEAVTAMFSACLGHGGDIGEPAVLKPILDRLGLPLPDMVELLPTVLAKHNEACRAGIDGVPMFLFGDDHGIAGAQPTEALAAMIALERRRLLPAAL